MVRTGPVAIACFFLYSGESLSSGFGVGGGPPGFRAEGPIAGVLGLIGDDAVCPLGKGALLVFVLGGPPAVVLIVSKGDRLG